MCRFTQSTQSRTRSREFTGSADECVRPPNPMNSVSTPFLHSIATEAARTLDEGTQLGMREVMLADDRRSWQMGPNGDWRRTEVIESIDGTVDTFEVLKEDAAASVITTDSSRGLNPGAGSMDPRA